jgi:DNA-binding response OmpR family regulator
MLEKLSITSNPAEDGRMAVDMFKAGKYDLVLMDGNMPEMDGVAATREIRRYEREHGLSATPIIALSAKVFADDRNAFIDAGADDFVVKPVSLRVLSAAIRSIFGAKYSVADERIDEYRSRCEYVSALSRKMGLPEKITEDLFREFIESLPSYADDILSAVESYDNTRIEHAAHRLKGVAASYDLDSLAVKCARLENDARSGLRSDYRSLAKEICAEVENVCTNFRRLFPLKN